MNYEKLFERIYYECNVKPLFEQILQEGVKRIKDVKGIEDYVSNIDTTFNNQDYQYLTDPNLNTKEKFDNEVDAQIKFVNQKRKTNGGQEQFLIYRVFEDKSKENIGYITCTKRIRNNGKILILDIRLVQEPGWFSNKSCKMLRILPFLSGCCSETEVSEQL